MSIIILRLNVTQFAPFGMSLGKVATSRLGTGPITCGDLDDDIGYGLTGGSNMDEVDGSRESSGSVGGAGGRDLRLEQGMLG